MELETITGNLQTYSELVGGTLLHADQLSAEQVSNSNLRNKKFYVADGALYSLENGVPTLWLMREPNNLVLRHVVDKRNNSFGQLSERRNYHPDIEEARATMAAEDTLRIDLTKLEANHAGGIDSGYFMISTKDYNSLNVEQRALAERLYGQGNDFLVIMAALSKARINYTSIDVLTPQYVRQQAKDGPIGRIVLRYAFDPHATTSVDVHHPENDYFLRGERKF